jgi:hypothetical protein
MTRAKTNAIDALRKLTSERQALDQRETELRHKAAAELGQLLLDCGAEPIDPSDLKVLLKAVVKLGAPVAIERLSA